MKLATIVGARPQFIKAAPVSRAIAAHNKHISRETSYINEVLVHTGQHYDNNMSTVFFHELMLPEPAYNLGVGSGSHGKQTGEMLKRIEEVLIKEQPDCVIVYGDTNSTLAGALAAVKLHIPVAHVEAGLRSFNRQMPEEINRLITDHISSLLFCPTETAVKNLAQEGITKGVHLVGDIMYDALLYSLQIAEKKSTILQYLQLQPKEYFLVTVHRVENIRDEKRLRTLVEAFRELSFTSPVIWPVHPHTRQRLVEFNEMFNNYDQEEVRMIDPVSYLDMLVLEKGAKAILTDSGGIQKEAFWLQVPCITLREETEWLETLEEGWNVIAGNNYTKIIQEALNPRPHYPNKKMFRKESASSQILHILVNTVQSRNQV